MRFTQFSPSSDGAAAAAAVGEKRARETAAKAPEQQQQQHVPRKPRLGRFAELTNDSSNNDDNDAADDDEIGEPLGEEIFRDQMAYVDGGGGALAPGVEIGGLDGGGGGGGGGVAASVARIWGTDIETAVVEDKFRTFLRTFCDVDDSLDASFRATADQSGAVSVDAIQAVAQQAARDDDYDRDDKKRRRFDDAATAAESAKSAASDDARERRPLYPALLEHMVRTQSTALNINCAYMRKFDMKLYEQMIEYPSEMLGLFDAVVHDELRATCAALGIAEPPPPPKVRPFALAAIAPLRALDPTNIDQVRKTVNLSFVVSLMVVFCVRARCDSWLQCEA
jgi:hypothetical protein